MDLKQCRTCLYISPQHKHLGDTISILDSSMKIAELIMACASVEIIMDDPLPNAICDTCIDYALNSYRFKRNCEESERELKLKLMKFPIKTEIKQIDLDLDDIFIAETTSETQYDVLVQNVSHEKFFNANQSDSDDDTPLVLLKNKSSVSNKKPNTKNGQKRKCLMCSLEFDTISLLLKHQKEHKEIKCVDCAKVVTTFGKLRRHKVRHCTVRLPAEYHCSTCNIQFSDNDKLATHRQLHNDHTCDYCGKQIMKEYEPNHMRKHEKNGLECIQCYATFNSLDSYWPHISSHTIFNCSDCSDTFTNIHHFRSHKEKHFFNETQSEYSTECLECGKSFDNRDTLFQHFQTHTTYTCQTCKRRIRNLYELVRHHRTKTCEKELNKRTCAVCNKVWPTPSAFKLHMSTHKCSNNGKNLPTCKYCQFMAGSSAALNKHMIASHDNLRNVQCPDCDKRFFNEISVRHHRRKVHGLARKSHVCDYCGKLFTTRSYLKEHARIHTGERLYSCAICQKQFTLHRTLVSHMDVHLPRQQHACVTCDKTFARKSDLRKHEKRHDGDRPFQCNACAKAFMSKYELGMHMVTHSDVHNYVCNMCDKSFGRKYNLTAHMKSHMETMFVTT